MSLSRSGVGAGGVLSQQVGLGSVLELVNLVRTLRDDLSNFTTLMATIEGEITNLQNTDYTGTGGTTLSTTLNQLFQNVNVLYTVSNYLMTAVCQQAYITNCVFSEQSFIYSPIESTIPGAIAQITGFDKALYGSYGYTDIIGIGNGGTEITIISFADSFIGLLQSGGMQAALEANNNDPTNGTYGLETEVTVVICGNVGNTSPDSPSKNPQLSINIDTGTITTYDQGQTVANIAIPCKTGLDQSGAQLTNTAVLQQTFRLPILPITLADGGVTYHVGFWIYDVDGNSEFYGGVQNIGIFQPNVPMVYVKFSTRIIRILPGTTGPYLYQYH